LVDFVSPSRMAFTHRVPRQGVFRLLKRSFDIAAGLLPAVTLPVMLVTAVAIWLEDGIGAQVLFSQKKVRLNGRIFRLLKFRSMRESAEADAKSRWASRNDSRVTRVGSAQLPPRRIGGRFSTETAIRPILRQEPKPWSRPDDLHLDRGSHPVRQRSEMSRGANFLSRPRVVKPDVAALCRRWQSH
jgi:hypothetical protein